MLTDLFEVTYYIIDNQFMRDYLHRLFSDMIDVLSRLTAVEYVPIRIEIYKHPRFNYFFYTYINEQVSPGIRSLFMNRRFPFSDFFTSFYGLCVEHFMHFLEYKCVTLPCRLLVCLSNHMVCFGNILGNFIFKLFSDPFEQLIISFFKTPCDS